MTNCACAVACAVGGGGGHDRQQEHCGTIDSSMTRGAGVSNATFALHALAHASGHTSVHFTWPRCNPRGPAGRVWMVRECNQECTGPSTPPRDQLGRLQIRSMVQAHLPKGTRIGLAHKTPRRQPQPTPRLCTDTLTLAAAARVQVGRDVKQVHDPHRTVRLLHSLGQERNLQGAVSGAGCAPHRQPHAHSAHGAVSRRVLNTPVCRVCRRQITP